MPDVLVVLELTGILELLMYQFNNLLILCDHVLNSCNGCDKKHC